MLTVGTPYVLVVHPWLPVAGVRQRVGRLNAETIKALGAPGVKAAIARQGSEVMATAPGQFGDYVRAYVVRIGKIARMAGIRAE